MKIHRKKRINLTLILVNFILSIKNRGKNGKKYNIKKIFIFSTFFQYDFLYPIKYFFDIKKYRKKIKKLK